eukprot:TRINITY_DN7559_c0_g1_i1.p1 TRINITY_DN7559_c0_g1~~TRINITY_DN7559_c0_g1_i1.p1  ORF type:complete len:1128 (+),score=226.98 TRINITY_DN7559_c0_g1_i1:11-3394(+)
MLSLGNVRISNKCGRNVSFNFRTRRRYTTFGIFGDIHFQDKGLDRIRRTSKWITEEFTKRKVDTVVCLGDVLNTRETVSVQAQSAAFEFFSELERNLPHAKIHILLGNHDMNLRHSRKISSLDGLTVHSHTENNRIKLYKEIEMVDILGKKCLFIPYHHEPNDIINYVNDLSKNSEDPLSEVVVFGHLSLNGAIQNNTFASYKGIVSTELFQNFQRTFSGHFHYHHELSNRVVYVGSPQQFNFGDAGQPRGVVIYDRNTDKYEHLTNPHGSYFHKIPEEELANYPPNFFVDTQIMVEFNKNVTNQYFSQIRERLLGYGAKNVRKHVFIEQLMKGTKFVKDSSSKIQSIASKRSSDMNHVLNDYVQLVHEKLLNLKKTNTAQDSFLKLLESEEKRRALLSQALEIFKLSEGKSISGDTPSQEGDGSVAGAPLADNKEDDASIEAPLSKDGNEIFDGSLSKLVIQDFMSIQGNIEIEFDKLNDGIWIIEGANGSGKSTIFEALVWCHFGEFLRSGMMKNDCINDQAKECCVRVEYKNGFVIERIRKKGASDSLKTYKLTYDDEKKENVLVYLAENEKGELKNSQQRINSILGIDYDIFTKSVVMGQNIVNNFLSGSQQQRRTIIEQTLGLEKLNIYYDTAKNLRVEVEQKIADLVNSENRIRKELNEFEDVTKKYQNEYESLQSSLKENNQKLTEHESRKDEELKELKNDIKTKSAQIVVLSDNLVSSEQKYNQLSTICGETATERIKSLKNQINEYSNQLLDMKSSHYHILDHLNKFNNKTCPTCGQSIKNDHNMLHEDSLIKLTCEKLKTWSVGVDQIDLLMKETTSEKVYETIKALIETCISETEKKSSCLEYEIKQHDQRLDEQKTEFEKIQKIKMDIKYYELDIIGSEKKILMIDSNAQINLNSITNQIAMITSKLQSIEQVSKDYEQLRSSKQVELNTATTNLSHLLSKYDLLKFWELSLDKKSKIASGFPTLRAFVFDDSIKDLNIILQSYIEQLSVDYNRDMTCTLNSDLDIVENYAKRSGGERKRTDLAVLFSLFEMVLDNSGYRPSFIMLDEVFDALDVNGRSAVQSVLNTLSKKLNKIFMITHSDITLGASMAGTIHVNMNVDNSGKALGSSFNFQQL